MGNNTLTIRALLFSPRSLVHPPACTASFCVFFFYRPTGRLRHTSLPAGMSSQTNNSEALRFTRAAFYNGLKSKVGLAAAKAAALRINLNVQGLSIVAAPIHAPSRTSTSMWLDTSPCTLLHTVSFFSPTSFHTISLSLARRLS